MKRYFEMRNWLIPLIAVAGALLILGCGDDGDGDSATCGNGTVETGEDCEGTSLGGATCESLNFTGGTLACGDDCKFNTTSCTSCDPVCDAGQCLTCDDGLCVSSCGVGEVCTNGVCGPDESCTDVCSADDCETCSGGECVVSCQGNETCVSGVCEVVLDCDPACDPSACEICNVETNTCESACTDPEECIGGGCIISPCEPACSGDTSFCNEIEECVMSECAAENCTQFDPNLHCDASDEGPGCFCNPGWVLNEERTGCVECADDDTSNELEFPTEVELPLDHTGSLCAWDVFAFDLDAGSTALIDLDGFDPGVNDLDIYLLLDNVEGVTAESSTSGDSTEHIIYTAPETQTYYLIVMPYSGPMPAEYHLAIRDTCESDEECGGFFAFCNDNDKCEITCEDDGVPNYLDQAEETDLPIEDMELTLCLDNADVFLFTLEAMDSLFVDLTFIHENGNLDTGLFFGIPGEEDDPVAYAQSTDDNESFFYTVQEAGEYYLYIVGDQNAYTLNVKTSCESDEECGGEPLVCNNGVCEIDQGVECEEDENEPNDDFDSPTYIEYPLPDVNDGDTVVPDLMLASGNEDWYEIRKDVGCNLNIDVNFSHADGDINVYLYESEDLLVDSYESEDNNEHIEYTPGGLIFSSYWLKIVTDDENVCIPYEIIVHYFCG